MYVLQCVLYVVARVTVCVVCRCTCNLHCVQVCVSQFALYVALRATMCAVCRCTPYNAVCRRALYNAVYRCTFPGDEDVRAAKQRRFPVPAARVHTGRAELPSEVMVDEEPRVNGGWGRFAFTGFTHTDGLHCLDKRVHRNEEIRPIV